MKSKSFYLQMIALILLSTACNFFSGSRELNVLVVNGGHRYDTTEFISMFEAMEGIQCEHAFKPDAWQLLEEGREFDALVFYDMYQEISEKEKKLFLEEFENGTGMVFLHHSLGSHQDWPEYIELVGGKFYMPDYTEDTSKILGWEHGITLQVKVIDTDHPVTEGVGDFEVIDEGYTNTELMPGLNYILETEHPSCDRYVGWTHSAGNSRVVYLMGGHDMQAYENPSFARLVKNAIEWTAGKRR